ncbi:ABC transporter permease [Rhizobium daejeonense]|uniref:ABC transporter permease n=1 Tax=Rhizobium daejeonense TaxID=240521 RepID=A0A6M1RXT8_9HYPH|nr:ABC transporter permease [Rhizobium daejeonense]NGO66412.1 ABC transporter permease [Rhizobium daejeonense]
MRIRHVGNLVLKELRGLMQDRMLFAFILYSFTLSIYTEARALPQVLNMAAIAIVDEDRSQLSTRLVDAFYPPYFTKPELITAAEMDKRMDSGQATFALNIPVNFQQEVLAGRTPALQLNIDATRMTQAFTGAGYIQNIVDSEISEFVNRYRSTPAVPVDLALRARFNPQLDNTWFGAINNIIMNITMLSIILTGAALIREREHGTIEHLLVMPVTALEIMVSKVLAMSLVVLIASTFSLIVVAHYLLGVPLQGSVPLFVAATALQLFAATSLGIFLATVAGSMPQFGLLLMLILLPLQVLSGGMTPRESMPEIIQVIMSFAPNTHFISMAQSILFRGAGMDVVWSQFLWLAAIGTVLFSFALGRFRAFLR